VPDHIITRVAQIPPADSLEAKALIGAAKEMMPNLTEYVNDFTGFLVGAMAGKACADLPEGARVVRVVIVAQTAAGSKTNA